MTKIIKGKGSVLAVFICIIGSNFSKSLYSYLEKLLYHENAVSFVVNHQLTLWTQHIGCNTNRVQRFLK